MNLAARFQRGEVTMSDDGAFEEHLPERMTLGEVRRAINEPKVFGVLTAGKLHDSRDIIIQIPDGEPPDEFGNQGYEYRTMRAIGSLFFRGSFTAVIAAGEIT